jgi:phosphatidylglycerol lysyltransferase
MKRTVVRHLLALAVAAMGVIDLLSALLSHPSDRLLALRHLVPTDVLDTSRSFTLLAGTLLLITAWGLRRGKRRAFVGALFLCALSVPVNLLKAFDFEEATVAAGLMFFLGMAGNAFQVKSRELSLRALRPGALAMVIGLAIYAVGGCWVIESIYSVHDPSMARAFAEALYQLFGVGDPTLLVPREHWAVRWFLGSISVMSFTMLFVLAVASLRPAVHRGRHRTEAARVAELLRQYGESTVSSFALGDDVDYFFSENGRAVIAYRFESGTLLAIGDPIGPAEEMPALLDAFERFCVEHDWLFAFYQARPERLDFYRRRGWRAVHIGEDPVILPDRFTLEGSAVASTRRAVRKLERDGIEARMFVPGDNPFDPANDPDGLLDQMREISSEWLRAHHGGEKGFCMGRFDPHHLPEVWLAVAYHPVARRVEAFCSWVPIWGRRGWAIDLMRRRADSVPGVTEFLVVKSVEKARERGDALMSLSLSALAKVDEEEPAALETPQVAAAPAIAAQADAPPVAPAPAPAPRPVALMEGAITDDRAREFLMERLGRFYDFKGLFRWKKKFDPSFEDRYLIYPEPLALPRIALALVRANSPGGLVTYFRRAA